MKRRGFSVVCFLRITVHIVCISPLTCWCHLMKRWSSSQRVAGTALQHASGNTEYLQVLAFTCGTFSSPSVCTIDFEHVKHLTCLDETIGSCSCKSKHKQLSFLQGQFTCMCVFCLPLKIQIYFLGSGQQSLHGIAFQFHFLLFLVLSK